jgi:eukaryotic-like serine/threonine-protein kinase
VSDYISATLQEGSQTLALDARPAGPQVIRARGDRRRRRAAAGLAVAALAVVAVAGGAYPLARGLSATPAAAGDARSIVPRVAGDTLAAAERAIVRAGLSIGHVGRQHSDAVPSGLVIGTAPRNGASLPKGATVGIVVSARARTVIVPDVLGMASPAAVSVLQQLRMPVQVRWAAYPTLPPGAVAAESPAAGTRAPRGATIVLYVERSRHGS